MKVKVTCGSLNVRKQPFIKDDNVICTLEEHQEVEFLELKRNWCKIKLVDGSIGFVKAEFTNVDEIDEGDKED